MRDNGARYRAARFWPLRLCPARGPQGNRVDIGRSVGRRWWRGKWAAKGSRRAEGRVFFDTVSGRGRTHVGVYRGNNCFIHSESERAMTVIDVIRSDFDAPHDGVAR